MSFMQEFKTFVMRGNIIDFAVGIIIGAAFGKIINSLVTDIIMPPIGMLVGGINFGSLSYVLRPAYDNHAEIALKYGAFLNTIIEFLIIALSIFILVKFINKYRAETPKINTKDCPQCLLPMPILAKRCGHCTHLVN
jgi:large conductance mechanosensitive channel